MHRGWWYLAAHDHVREAARTFRVDRIDEVRPAHGAPVPPPAGFDAAAAVARALARVPWRWAVRVELELPLEAARRKVPATFAELTAVGEDRTRVELRAEELDWVAALLAGLGCGFTIEAPDELAGAVRALGARLAAVEVRHPA